MEKSKDNILIENSKLQTTPQVYFEDAHNIKLRIKETLIHLIITSPPYWKIKDYGNRVQIEYNDSLKEYFEKLNQIWKECIRVLHPGCKICINIGDQFLWAIRKTRPFQIIPLHSLLISTILTNFREKLVYLGSINWNKRSTSHTSGGGHIMGSIFSLEMDIFLSTLSMKQLKYI